MAFNLNRQPNEEQNNTNFDCEKIDTSHPEVVATRGWIFNILGHIYAWGKKFVTKNIITDVIHTQRSISDVTFTKKLVLVDEDGNKNQITIKDGVTHVTPFEDDIVELPPDGCDCSTIINTKPLDPSLFDDNAQTICTCCKH